MGMGTGAGMGFDAAGSYRYEKEMLQLTRHEWGADKAERELLGARYPGTGVDLLDISR